MDAQTPYFLGAILFAPGDEYPHGSEANRFYVLDGQQRLVTLSLLIAAAKFRFKQFGDGEAAGKIDALLRSGRFGEEPLPKLQLRERDQDLYCELLKSGSESRHLRSPNHKKRPLARAWHILWEYVGRIDDPRELENRVNRVLHSVRFVRIVAADESEAYALFETLNDRGLKLNAADLVKNRVLSMIVDKSRLKDAQRQWDEMLCILGKHRANALQFVRHFYMARDGFVRKHDLYRKIRQKLAKAKAEGDSERAAVEFVKDLREDADIYSHIVAPNHGSWTEDAKRRLERLSMFAAVGFRPVILLAQRTAAGNVAAILKMIEAVTVRYSVIGGKNANILEKEYAAIAEELRSGSVDKTVEIVRRHLEAICPNDEEFESQFCRFEVGRKVTKKIRALLLALHDVLTYGATNPAEPKSLNVDHVLPISLPRAALEHGKMSKNEADDVVEKLGNLTFLREKINKSVLNRPFPDKRHEYQRAAGLPLTQELADYERWDVAAIEDRTKRLAGIAKQAWPNPLLQKDDAHPSVSAAPKSGRKKVARRTIASQKT